MVKNISSKDTKTRSEIEESEEDEINELSESSDSDIVVPQEEKDDTLLIPQDEYLASGCHIGTKLKTIHSEQWIYRITSYGLYVIDLMQTDTRIRIAAKFLASFEPNLVNKATILLVFGSIRMKPKSRGGKTIKEYSVNIRMTDIQKGIEVLRTRSKVNKFSDQSSTAW